MKAFFSEEDIAENLLIPSVQPTFLALCAITRAILLLIGSKLILSYPFFWKKKITKFRIEHGSSSLHFLGGVLHSKVSYEFLKIVGLQVLF